MAWLKLFGVVPLFKIPDPPTPTPPPAAPAPDPAIASAIRGVQQRKDRTAATEHRLLTALDTELVKLQATLGKKLIQAIKAEQAGTPNAALETEIAGLEQKEANLDTRIAALEAYLRAAYPAYWRTS